MYDSPTSQDYNRGFSPQQNTYEDELDSFSDVYNESRILAQESLLNIGVAGMKEAVILTSAKTVMLVQLLKVLEMHI